MDKTAKDISLLEKGVVSTQDSHKCAGNKCRSGRRLKNVALAVSTAALVMFATMQHGSHGGKPHRKQPSAALENMFLSIPNESSALASSRSYATHPHIAGSKEDYKDAVNILGAFQTFFGITPNADSLPVYEAGSELSRNATLNTVTRNAKGPTAWIDKYYPLLQSAIDHSLTILDPDGKVVFNASLEEVAEEGDEEAHRYKDAVSAWHGFSGNGTVSGHLVYANLGRKEDYDAMSDEDIKGKIVIVRYGGNFRGLKVKGAEDRGAAGVLIYSDPRDDGVTVEMGYAPYPDGPARNPSSVQRGSVQFLSFYPGDPTTPGFPAYENATRVEAENMPKIPSLPISWKTAERLFEEIHQSRSLDRAVWNKWGSSNSTIKLVNNVDTKVAPIWNTMASIPGHIRDEVVMIGCHRDAWVMGAADPTSGTVSLLEVIRAFGHLYEQGWRPLRTIVFASWDAEEYGLIGSTEFGEDFAEWIKKHVVAYLNVDVSVAGSRFHTSASPSLSHLIRDVAQKIPHPTDANRTLWDARTDSGPYVREDLDPEIKALLDGETDAAFDAEKLGGTGVGALGSGSDYTVFLQHLGVASSDEGFGVTSSDAVWHYHSIYDSQNWQEVYGDPGFHRHVAVAKHLGLVALRLTDSIILPLNTTQYSIELSQYLTTVEALNSTLAPDFQPLRNSLAKLEKYSLTLDKEKRAAEKKFMKLLRRIPRRSGPCRHDRFRKLKNWIKRVFGVRTSHNRKVDLRVHASALEVAYSYIDDDIRTVPKSVHGFPMRKFIEAAHRVRAINHKLKEFEAGLIDEAGIKERTWYRHLGVAAGKWSGYGATTLPGLTEALTEEKDADLAKHETQRLDIAIKKMAAKLSSHC